MPSVAADGRVLAGRYRLEEKLAAGGMAEVWEATDEVLARKVAVKLLHRHLAADESFVERFRREAVSAARLSHPAIVSIFDTCSDDGDEAIVMELVKGDTLRDCLANRGPLPIPRAVDVVAQVADALAFAHRAGVVHRDVKPGNILMCDDGRVLVTDFGIAKAAEETNDLTATGAIVGTAKYLAPEQVEGGAVDQRADVYALGVVLYELLCGRPPFVADTDLATAVLRLSSEPPKPRQVRAGIPRTLETIVLKAMARDPADRYASAEDLRSALLATNLAPDDDDETSFVSVPRDPTGVIATRPAGAAGASTEGPSFTQTERSWLVPAFLVALIAVALGVAGVLLGRTDVGQDLIEEAKQAVGVEAEADAEPVGITGVQAFDPQGSGGEHDDEALFALDQNPDTAWTTERYRVRQLGGLKDGVGLIMTLERSADVDELVVVSPTNGWAARVYVAAQPAADIDGWGAPVTEQTDIGSGEVTFDLGGASGAAVLLWITDVGDGDLPASAEIAEVRVSG